MEVLKIDFQAWNSDEILYDLFCKIWKMDFNPSTLLLEVRNRWNGEEFEACYYPTERSFSMFEPITEELQAEGVFDWRLKSDNGINSFFLEKLKAYEKSDSYCNI